MKSITPNQQSCSDGCTPSFSESRCSSRLMWQCLGCSRYNTEDVGVASEVSCYDSDDSLCSESNSQLLREGIVPFQAYGGSEARDHREWQEATARRMALCSKGNMGHTAEGTGRVSSIVIGGGFSSLTTFHFREIGKRDMQFCPYCKDVRCFELNVVESPMEVEGLDAVRHSVPFHLGVPKRVLRETMRATESEEQSGGATLNFFQSALTGLVQKGSSIYQNYLNPMAPRLPSPLASTSAE